MTIERGASWGERTSRPDPLRVAADDRELAIALGSGEPTTVRSGDMLRTLGGPTGKPDGGVREGGAPDEFVLAVPIDLLDLRLDGRDVGPVVAHVLVRSQRRRGGLLRGPVVFVMNAEFMGRWDVAPRGHPNDGRVEVVSCDAALDVRQRLAARRRLETATHLPHPGITSRSMERASFTFDRPMVVVADGQRLGRARSVEFEVRPDAAMLYV
jgi:hypothetical protein